MNNVFIISLSPGGNDYGKQEVDCEGENIYSKIHWLDRCSTDGLPCFCYKGKKVFPPKNYIHNYCKKNLEEFGLLRIFQLDQS